MIYLDLAAILQHIIAGGSPTPQFKVSRLNIWAWIYVYIYISYIYIYIHIYLCLLIL